MHRIACIQFQPVWKDVATNVSKIQALLQKLEHVTVAIFPELATTGYVFQNQEEAARFASSAEDKGWDIFRRIAKHKDMAIVLGAPIQEKGKIHNSVLIFFPDGSTAVYHKIHLFDHEKECFAPGPAKPAIYQVHELRFSALICFDWLFPELWRSLALQGVDLITLSANLVLAGKCQKGLFAHAMCNRIYVAMANRYGQEEELQFTGNSRIVGPDGEIVTEAPAVGERILLSDIDVSLARNKQISQHNHVFVDRRPEMYN